MENQYKVRLYCHNHEAIREYPITSLEELTQVLTEETTKYDAFWAELWINPEVVLFTVEV